MTVKVLITGGCTHCGTRHSYDPALHSAHYQPVCRVCRNPMHTVGAKAERSEPFKNDDTLPELIHNDDLI